MPGFSHIDVRTFTVSRNDLSVGRNLRIEIAVQIERDADGEVGSNFRPQTFQEIEISPTTQCHQSAMQFEQSPIESAGDPFVAFGDLCQIDIERLFTCRRRRTATPFRSTSP